MSDTKSFMFRAAISGICCALIAITPEPVNAEANAAPGYVKTDRYTLVSTQTRAEQVNPLLSITTIKFGQNIHTLGQAIDELLAGSGYAWVKAAEQNDALAEMLLPTVVREMGPLSLRDALITLAGVAWELQVNELNRTVWFTPLKAYDAQPK